MSPNPVYLKNPKIQQQSGLSEEAILVRNTLIQYGLETPMIETGLNAEQKYARIRELMTDVVSTLGLDLSDDSLAETPHRIAKMYVHEIFSGLDYRHFPKLSLIENKMGANEMVKVRDIDLTSTCEHHFVTIDGTAKVAYIPKDTIIGLSKINRVVKFFGQRPQVQERLTNQIAETLMAELKPTGVAVVIEASHSCMTARGVRTPGVGMVTSRMMGTFLEDQRSRKEVLSLMGYG